VKRSAVFSPCGKFRHLLIRRWVDDLPLLVFGLLNPSVANDEKDDPTARKGIGFARELGYGGMVFFNIFDYCATYPKDLKKASYPNSPDADRYILDACAMGDGTVICGWGAIARAMHEKGFSPDAGGRLVLPEEWRKEIKPWQNQTPDWLRFSPLINAPVMLNSMLTMQPINMQLASQREPAGN
jgi:hypothetical protein